MEMSAPARRKAAEEKEPEGAAEAHVTSAPVQRRRGRGRLLAHLFLVYSKCLIRVSQG